MPLKIIRQDITKIECDAVVNPSNRHLSPGGGADAAIHEAAGAQLLEACKALGGCEAGKAKITPGFNLPCKYVIHTAGPNWHTFKKPESVLISCYEECLKAAVEAKCESVAFPLISSGSYGFPKDKAIKIATRVISDFLFENEMLVYLVIYDKTAFGISKKIFSEIESYIDDNYVEEREITAPFIDTCNKAKFSHERKANVFSTSEIRGGACYEEACMPAPAACVSEDTDVLDSMLKDMDKGFADTLFYYIDKKSMTDVECYKRSNVDKKTFSKIKCNKDYRPSKKTAVSFAVGLKLDEEETAHLLNTAGYSLSKSDKFDVIIRYFISTGNYESIFDVNEVLYHFDQVTLGV